MAKLQTKKLLILVILFLFSMTLFAEQKMIINFTPSKVFQVELDSLDFIDKNGYDDYHSFIESLEKGRRVFFEHLIPKTGIIEGEYQILIYEDNICVGKYTIIGDHFVYNEDKGFCQKVPNVLNNLRAILYLEYLASQSRKG